MCVFVTFLSSIDVTVEELSHISKDKNSFLRAKKAVIWHREGVVSKISSFSLLFSYSFIHSIIDLSFIPHLFIHSMRIVGVWKVNLSKLMVNLV